MLLNLKNKLIHNFAQKFELGNIDQGLLRQAFTHSSAGKTNNERLEFFGDAVLDCILSEELYLKLPTAKENYLTRLRSHLVNKSTLSNSSGQYHGGQGCLWAGQGEADPCHGADQE